MPAKPKTSKSAKPAVVRWEHTVSGGKAKKPLVPPSIKQDGVTFVRLGGGYWLERFLGGACKNADATIAVRRLTTIALREVAKARADLATQDEEPEEPQERVLAKASTGRAALGLMPNQVLQQTSAVRRVPKTTKRLGKGAKGLKRPVAVSVQGVDFPATHRGKCLFIPLSFDPERGQETNLTKILNHLVQCAQEGTSESDEDKVDKGCGASCDDDECVKFIKNDTDGGGKFKLCWLDHQKKRRRDSTQFRVPGKDPFGEDVAPGQLRKDIVKMRQAAKSHWDSVDKSLRLRYSD